MSERPRGWLVTLLATMGLGAVPDALAQTRSTLTGSIRDGDGATLAGVTLTLAGDSIPGEAQTAITNVRGAYRFAELPSGVYELTSTRGSQTVKRTGLRLPAGTTLS